MLWTIKYIHVVPIEWWNSAVESAYRVLKITKKVEEEIVDNWYVLTFITEIPCADYIK